MADFILANWEWFLLGFYVCEKVVKVTPSKKDDILLDMVWYGIRKLVKK